MRSLKRLWQALRGNAVSTDRWLEAEAAESNANLKGMGIFSAITGVDIAYQSRWAAQARREQLGWKWDYQARREALNIASKSQESEQDE